MVEILSALVEVNLAWTDKWRAVQMLMYVLCSRNYHWDIKSWSFEFLSLFDGSSSEEASQDERLFSVHNAIVMIKVMSCLSSIDVINRFNCTISPFQTIYSIYLQKIESMRTSVPDESVRTKAYAGIKKASLLDLPSIRIFKFGMALVL
jgi:hypothetical protein